MRQSMIAYLNALVFAFWIGGFTFYAVIVVPIGTDVLGTVEQGFVTQQVTNYLNVIGAVSLAYLSREALKQRRWAVTGTWVFMALSQAALFALHHWLDGMLDHESMTELVPQPDFYAAHRIYLLVAAAQWAAALAHFWYVFNPPAGALAST